MHILPQSTKALLFAPEPEIISSGTLRENDQTDLSATDNSEFSPTVTSTELGATVEPSAEIDPSRDVPPASVSEAALRAKQFRDAASERWHAVGERAKEMNFAAQDRIRQSPTKAVFGALGLGLLVGLVMKRASA